MPYECDPRAGGSVLYRAWHPIPCLSEFHVWQQAARYAEQVQRSKRISPRGDSPVFRAANKLGKVGDEMWIPPAPGRPDPDFGGCQSAASARVVVLPADANFTSLSLRAF